MSDHGAILTSRPAAGVVQLTIDRPARRNAVTPAMRLALLQAVRQAQADPEVGALVLTGSKGHFCAGGDLEGLSRLPKPDLPALLRSGHELVTALVQGVKPVVAAVAGNAAGGGAGLALACDVVLCASDAKFVLPFHRIGLVADYGLAWTLARRLGPGRTQALLLRPRPIPAPEALAMGLADEVLEPGMLLERALAAAAAIASESRLATRWTRELMRAQLPPLQATLDLELQAQQACFSSPEFERGVGQFLGRG